MSEALVIYRLGSLGDTIVALPCFHKIAEAFPNHRRIVLTNFPMSRKAASIEVILENGGFIHGAIAYPYGTRDPRLLLSVIQKIRELHAETLIYVGGGRGIAATFRDLLFFRVAGIRRVIGAPRTRDLDTGRVDPATGIMESEASRLARCLTELGPIDLADPKAWDLRLTQQEIAQANEVLDQIHQRPFIAVNTGGKLAVQDWGEANWTELLSRLSSNLPASLVFVGSAEDISRAEKHASSWNCTVLNACGRLSPRETAALLRQATVFIGHDSGPLHLAAANGVPCVGLFGSNNPPGKWFPQGAQHRIHHNASDVRRILPTAVAASVLELWEDAAQTGKLHAAKQKLAG